VIQALQDGRLLFSGDKVFIKDKAGATLDAATGKPAAAPADAANVRLNNRLRRSVEAALGGLTLMSNDPARRYEAAQAVFKSRDANALATLDAALAKETDARVKRALSEARAAVILYQASAARTTRSPRSAPSRSAPIRTRAGCSRACRAGRRRRCRRPLRDAITSIDNRLALWNMVQNAWYGLSLGSVLLLAAIGLAITFGVMGVINMAHGEMVMLGAYVTFMVQEIIRARYPGAVRCVAVHRCAARVPVRRKRRHPDRADGDPIPVRPAAGNAARHLGHLADPAAGRAHDLRADQQGSRQSLLDERRVRVRRHHHHL
jgi:urea transport system permease protein